VKAPRGWSFAGIVFLAAVTGAVLNASTATAKRKPPPPPPPSPPSTSPTYAKNYADVPRHSTMDPGLASISPALLVQPGTPAEGASPSETRPTSIASPTAQC